MGSAEIGTLLAYVLPLGLDSFAVAAAAGVAGLTGAARWRLSALFVAFEAGMPLIGLALGVPFAHAAGAAADYVGALVLIVVGGWMLFSGDEEEPARSLSRAHGLALLGIGVSVSLDELAIGFSLGASRLPVSWVIVAIGMQAFVAAQLGVRLGARLGERMREGAELLAGLALAALGAFLLIYPLMR